MRFCNHEGLNNKIKTTLTLDDYVYLFTVCKNNFNWKSISITGGEPLLYRQFDELANDKDKIVPMHEIKSMLEQLGLKENAQELRKVVMSDNVIITRTSCEAAKISNDVSETCAKNMDLFVTPNGAVNHCFVTNEQSLILEEVRARNDDNLVKKLTMINDNLGKNCIYKNLNNEKTL